MTELPRGWTEAVVTEIAAVHDARRVPLNATQRAEMKGGFPYYGANGLVDCVNEYLFDGEYVLLAEDGGYFDNPKRGVAYEVKGKFWVNNHAHILKPLGEIAPRFLCYQLNSINWMPFVGGSTRLKLTQGGLERARVAVPPLREQRRIVAKIDSLTGKSKRARDHLDHIPRLVEKYKQAVLAAAFRGDLTREWRCNHPDVEIVQSLLARTQEPDQSRGGREATADIKPGVAALSVNDPGSALPYGWEWVKLRRIARQETGHTPSRSKPSFWGGGIPWIGIRDAGAHHGTTIHKTIQTISSEGLENSSARLLPAGQR